MLEDGVCDPLLGSRQVDPQERDVEHERELGDLDRVPGVCAGDGGLDPRAVPCRDLGHALERRQEADHLRVADLVVTDMVVAVADDPAAAGADDLPLTIGGNKGVGRRHERQREAALPGVKALFTPAAWVGYPRTSVRTPYIVVDRIVGPRELSRPGLYVASSETPGYGALLAAATVGVVERVGDHVMPGRVETIAVRRRGRWGNPEIGISAAWYQRILNDYQGWREAWWREAIQNAVDAGAKNVRCEVREQPDGTYIVSSEDDGRGMTKEVLIDKFLQLGGTTKIAGEMGGFGAAKELLILPWLRWQVSAGNLVAEGVANQYELREVDEPRKGVRIEVTMPADQRTNVSAAIAFVEKCELPGVKFHAVEQLYGEDKAKIDEVFRGKLRAQDLLEEIPGRAAIYVSKVDYRGNYLYVRVNGLFMFTQYVGETKGRQLIAEITAPSTEVLTKNRDGFRDNVLQRALGHLGERVAKDVQSALRTKAGMIRQKYEGAGKFEVLRREAAALSMVGPISPTEDGVTMDIDAVAQASGRMALSLTLLRGIELLGPNHVENAVRQLVWEPDFFLINEIENYRVPARFRPETMKPRVVKLVAVWTELCRFVLMQLGSKERFGVGLMFSEYYAAAYQPDEDEHWLLLNPFKDMRGREKVWQPSNIDDRKWLYAAAVHECTHLADGIEYHDESFAAALTRNIAKTADGFRKVAGIVREIKEGTLPPLRQRAATSNPVGSTSTDIAATKRRLSR